MNFGRRTRHVLTQFPGTFWVLIGAAFIDQLGGFILFPFFALYITARYGVGLTEVGILFAIFSISALFGNIVGGAMTDRFGRRWMIMFGLIVSALGSVAMGFSPSMNFFYFLAMMVGLVASAGGPARQAMVADLLPEERLADGYGIERIAANLAATIGPALGGLLAHRSFMLLFVADAITSIIMAIIVYFSIPETKPERHKDDHEPEENLIKTVKGYGIVLRDRLFVAFILVSILANIVYSQMNSTLSVYLRDNHGVSIQRFGYILSLNAAMVVLFQFWITRRVSSRPPMLVMAGGTLLYGVGFAMYGLVGAYGLFMLAMVIITVGEMVTAPVMQATVARLAPERMRGRYMAAFGYAWMIPFATGPLLAGLVMDNLNPDLVWYGSGVIGLVAAAGYLILHERGKAAVSDSTPAVDVTVEA